MNRVLFKLGKREVKVFHVVIVILFILFLIGLRACNQTDKSLLKEEKIEDICTVKKENLYDLTELLKRSDLCSEQWFKDFSDYIKRLDEQNELLKKKDKNHVDKEVYDVQLILTKNLKDFDKEQSVENLEKIEDTIKQYMELVNECQGENNGKN